MADQEAVDHPFEDRAVLQVEHQRREHQDRADQCEQNAGQVERTRRTVEEPRFHDHPQETQAIADHAQFGFAHTLVIRHVQLGNLNRVGHHSARAHGRREVQTIGQGKQMSQAGPAHHAHAARGIAHARAGENTQQESEDGIAQPPEERHLALFVQAASEHYVRIIG